MKSIFDLGGECMEKVLKIVICDDDAVFFEYAV